MAFDLVLADRMREVLAEVGPMREIKMFGGLCFTYRGNMICGLLKGDGLILRLGPEGTAAVIASGQARAFMPMKGKAANGMAVVEDAAALDDEPLRVWLMQAAAFVETLPAKE